MSYCILKPHQKVKVCVLLLCALINPFGLSVSHGMACSPPGLKDVQYKDSTTGYGGLCMQHDVSACRFESCCRWTWWYNPFWLCPFRHTAAPVHCSGCLSQIIRWFSSLALNGLSDSVCMLCRSSITWAWLCLFWISARMWFGCR